MARPRCSVCANPQIAAINKALARPGTSVKLVAESFALDRTTLWRHQRVCLARQLSKAIERQDVISGASFISESLGVRNTVAQSLQQVAESGNHALVAPLASAHVKVSEHVARLAGMEGYKPSASVTNVDARGSRILIMPQGEDSLALPPANPLDTP